MDREGLDVDQLDRGAVEAFLAAHVRAHGHVPSAGVMPLLDYLRGEGVIDPERGCCVASPLTSTAPGRSS